MNENIMGFLEQALQNPEMKDKMMQMAKGSATSGAANYSKEISAMAKKFGINLTEKETKTIIEEVLADGKIDFNDIATIAKVLGAKKGLGSILGGLGSLLTGKK